MTLKVLVSLEGIHEGRAIYETVGSGVCATSLALPHQHKDLRLPH